MTTKRQDEIKINKIIPEYDGEMSSNMCARWYRPPEVILDRKIYDCQVDVWSLGCVFAEILCAF